FDLQVDPIGPINVDLGPDFALCPLADSLLNPLLPGTYQYLWQDGSTNPVFTAVGPGVYFVEVRNSCNLGRDTVVVNSDNLPAPNFTLQDSLCPGEATLINLNTPVLPAATYNYSLDGGSIVGGGAPASVQVVWNSPGLKTVCLEISQDGCTEIVCENVFIKNPPSVFINPVADQCFPPAAGYDFTTVGGPADVYQWEFGNSANPPSFSGPNPPTINYLSPGLKQVTLVTFTQGCVSEDTAEISFQVINPPSANFAISNSNICRNELVQFTYPGPPLGPTQTFSWNFGAGAVPSSSTQRNPGQVRYTTSGPKTISLTVGFGPCVVTSTQTVVVSPTPNVTAGLDQSFCEGDGGVQLDATVSGGRGNYFYNWSCDRAPSCGFNAVNVEDPTVNPTAFNPPEDISYFFQVTDLNGCVSQVDTVIVRVKAKPKMDAGPDLSLCENESGIFLQGSIAADNQAPLPITYQWSPAAGLFGNQNVLNPLARPDTTTIYTLIGSSANGCTSDATTVDPQTSMVLSVRPVPTADAGLDTGLCIGSSVRLNGVATGAGPGYTYTWTASPAGSLDDPSSATPLATPTQTTIYTLVVTSGGCVSSGDNVRVQVDTKPTVSPGVGGSVCLFEPFPLAANASGDLRGDIYTYQWRPGRGLSDSTIADPIATPLQTTTYQVSAVSEFGCASDPAAVTLTLKPTPEVSLLAEDTTLCSDDTLSLTASHTFRTAPAGPVNYRWVPSGALVGQSASDSVLVSPDISGLVIVEAFLAGEECSTQDSIFIQVEPAIEVQLEADTTRFCAGDSTALRAQGGSGSATFEWSPSLGLSNGQIANPLAKPGETTLYTVTVREGACATSAAIAIQVNPIPSSEFFSTLPSGCGSLEVSFMENAGPNAVAYLWDFGDGSPITNEANPVHLYEAPGTYQVTFVAIGEGGCEAVNTQTLIQVDEGPELTQVLLPDSTQTFPSGIPLRLLADGPD
ncbi:MAG: PKD domain-containing protein, partial [Bacteroidota bacterium]